LNTGPEEHRLSDRPNVLLICVDQWPGRLLAAAGHPDIETPTLDRLCELGTRFDQAYSESPICIPARRSIMTGTSPRVHGDRVFQPSLTMPALPTLAGTFREHGYQAFAVGKLHVYPQRDRIGFDDVLLAEEGRSHLGSVDDYELFLADAGHVGEQFAHGMSNNEYGWRPWHLPEQLHVTNWITREACRMIRRRDPRRPALWHVSYTHPHPPLAPLAEYLERYRHRPVTPARYGDWSLDENALPYPLRQVRRYWARLPEPALAEAKRAFYSLCTHIDHQLRLIIGTLREASLINDTIIMLVSDHGDMLGDHGLFAKRLMYDASVRVPMILVGRAGDTRVARGRVDRSLAGLQDVMPTLLDLADLPAPASCTGYSLLGSSRRAHLYCESLEGASASRMVTDGRHKFIWYPAGNREQLFDLDADTDECNDLAAAPGYRDTLETMRQLMIGELHGSDLQWLQAERLHGTSEPATVAGPDRGLSGQRGLHFPPLESTDPAAVIGAVADEPDQL
jgi:arylsulfatase A-like enzyme